MTLSTSSQFQQLQSELLDYIAIPLTSGGDADDPFNELALAVFAFQFEHNAPYGNFCRSLGDKSRLPQHISHWSQIPAVPTDAFKHFGLDLSIHNGDTDYAAVFRTSGTTSERSGQRGEHGFASLDLYNVSILQCWKDLALPELPMRFLTPSPAAAPDSSLAHMMGALDQQYRSSNDDSATDHFFIDATGSLDLQRLRKEIEQLDSPILLAGTALAFLHLFEGNPPPLPDGSQILETGGYKGVSIKLDKSAFYEKLSRTFAVSIDDIHNEYSMTELSSQFYTQGLGAPHRGPHWTRVRVIDPETEEASQPGATGFIEILDLANLGSCIALRTADLAIAKTPDEDNGDRATFTLAGRDPAALERGCSRSADEMLGN